MSPPRLPNGRFPPGASGNPGGRARLLGEVIALARQYTAEAIATLAAIMADPAAPAATRVAAASALLDRAWGKPLMALTVDDTRPVEALTDAELEAIIRAEWPPENRAAEAGEG